MNPPRVISNRALSLGSSIPLSDSSCTGLKRPFFPFSETSINRRQSVHDPSLSTLMFPDSEAPLNSHLSLQLREAQP
jgi:hypothetical protein